MPALADAGACPVLVVLMISVVVPPHPAIAAQSASTAIGVVQRIAPGQ
jgi:hypothetical protein